MSQRDYKWERRRNMRLGSSVKFIFCQCPREGQESMSGAKTCGSAAKELIFIS